MKEMTQLRGNKDFLAVLKNQLAVQMEFVMLMNQPACMVQETLDLIHGQLYKRTT
jgi:hypothetical protein